MRKFIPLLVIAGLLLWAVPAFSATRTWDNDDTDNSWNNANNWSDNTKPVDGDVALFDVTDCAACNIDADPAGVDAIVIASNYTGTVTNAVSTANVDSVYIDATGDATLALGAYDLQVKSFVVVNSDGDDVTYSAGGKLTFEQDGGKWVMTDTGNAVPVQVTDGAGTTINVTRSDVCCARSITLGEADTLTGAGADDILKLVPVGNDFIVVGTGADMKTAPCDMYLDAARTNGAVTAATATFGIYPMTAAITGLQLTGAWVVGGFTVYSHALWDTKNPDSAFTIDFNDQNFTTANLYLNNRTANTDTMVNELLTGTGIINTTGVFHLNSNDHCIGIITMEGCSLKVAGNVTENDNDTSRVTGSGVLCLNGSAGQSVSTPAVGAWPRVYCANTHADGVTFEDAMTCSTLQIATATTEDITFKEGVTSTVISTCNLVGTRGQTDIESGSAGTAATLSLPVGNSIRDCDVKDIVGTGRYIDAAGCVSNGGNSGAIKFRRD
jgi:hypothetical protein